MNKYFSPRTYNQMRKTRGTNSCKCMAGHIHDSRFEAKVCTGLQFRQKAGEKVTFDRQVTFPLDVNGKKICSHRVDFLLEFPDGRKEVLEAKGFIDPTWPIKKNLFEALYQDIPYIVIRK